MSRSQSVKVGGPACTLTLDPLVHFHLSSAALIRRAIAPVLGIVITKRMPHADSAFFPPEIQTKTAFWDHIHVQLQSLLVDQRSWVRKSVEIFMKRSGSFNITNR
jgi:hypothetical protein